MMENVYTLARIYDFKGSFDKNPEFRFEVLSWSANQTEVTKLPLELQQKFITVAELREDREGNLFAAGYYSSTPYTLDYKRKPEFNRVFPGTDGGFVIKLHRTADSLKVSRTSFSKFPDHVLKQNESQRSLKKAEKNNKGEALVANNLALRGMVVRENGSVEMYGEEYFTVQHADQPKKHYYQDILGMSIGLNGEMEWAVKIPKRQGGASKDFSFKLYPYNGYTYVFFEDNIDNLALNEDQVPSLHGDQDVGCIQAVRISPTGQSTRMQVLNDPKHAAYPPIRSFKRIKAGSLLSGQYDKGNSRLMLIKFHQN
jgi:hypothetical protein